MQQDVIWQKQGGAGIITLNRPQAINALTLEMIGAMTEAFDDYAADPDVALLLIEGVGERGFCAGADVRALRELALDGDAAGVRAFFEAEYALDLKIAESQKPVVALTHGIVMGGGIGLAGHAHYRITCDDGRFAMPEAGIGMHTDVAVTAILAMAEPHRALAFLMSGETVGAEEALALGLADCAIASDRRDEVRAAVISASHAEDVPAALVSLMQAESIVAGGTPFLDAVDGLQGAFSAGNAEDVRGALDVLSAENDDAAVLRDVLAGRCPASLAVIHAAFAAARLNPSRAAAFERDLRLCCWLTGRADFTEGVRAQLVDKDRKPVWTSGQVSDTDRAQIARLVLGRGAET